MASGVYTIQCATPTYSPTAGTFTSSTSVTISTTTSGASIRYTTNGTTPSSTVGTVYSSAVSITATSTLQAIAYETGLTNSAVASGVYTIQCANPDVQPGGGHLYYVGVRHHLHGHRWGKHPLHHQRDNTEFDGGHGVQQHGEHHRHLHAGGHRL